MIYNEKQQKHEIKQLQKKSFVHNSTCLWRRRLLLHFKRWFYTVSKEWHCFFLQFIYFLFQKLYHTMVGTTGGVMMSAICGSRNRCWRRENRPGWSSRSREIHFTDWKSILRPANPTVLLQGGEGVFVVTEYWQEIQRREPPRDPCTPTQTS